MAKQLAIEQRLLILTICCIEKEACVGLTKFKSAPAMLAAAPDEKTARQAELGYAVSCARCMALYSSSV